MSKPLLNEAVVVELREPLVTIPLTVDEVDVVLARIVFLIRPQESEFAKMTPVAVPKV